MTVLGGDVTVNMLCGSATVMVLGESVCSIVFVTVVCNSPEVKELGAQSVFPFPEIAFTLQ